jgi:hypothetical protein
VQGSLGVGSAMRKLRSDVAPATRWGGARFPATTTPLVQIQEESQAQ